MPEEPNESAQRSQSSQIFMRWQQSADPDEDDVLLEIAVDYPGAAIDLGRHLRQGIVDVDLVAPNDIIENIPPDPPGTPITMGAGQHVLRTCQFGGALFNE